MIAILNQNWSNVARLRKNDAGKSTMYYVLTNNNF